MLKELGRALENDELYVALLPKISLRGTDELMAEALMRWEHPERGALNPGEFIPFAEKTGFITSLTNWMIGASLDVAAKWQARGTPLTISVNISPRDLDSPDFATAVVERLRARKLRGQVLTLEVTESAVLDASPIVRQNLEVLSRLGVKLAIDDFGSGFASLDQLRALPLSYMMVDRQFVRGLSDDESSRIIVQAAIDIGHTLGLTVVGEGVESDGELNLLREMGCDEVQGFFVSKPLNEDQFEAWVSDRARSFGPATAMGELVAGSVAAEGLDGLAAVAAGEDSMDAGVLMVDDQVSAELGAAGTAEGSLMMGFDFGGLGADESTQPPALDASALDGALDLTAIDAIEVDAGLDLPAESGLELVSAQDDETLRG
ncbi:MAG: EAL domain-containing protein [Burkholderiaceae bacterium]